MTSRSQDLGKALRYRRHDAAVVSLEGRPCAAAYRDPSWATGWSRGDDRLRCRRRRNVVAQLSGRFGLVELVVGWAAAELPTRQALALLRRPPAEPDVSLSAHRALQCSDPLGAWVPRPRRPMRRQHPMSAIKTAVPETGSRPLPGYNADAEARLAGSTEQARSPRARPRRSRCLATQR